MEHRFYDQIVPKSDSELIDIYLVRNDYQPQFVEMLTAELERRHLLKKAELIVSFSGMSEEELLEIKEKYAGDELLVRAADKSLGEAAKRIERPLEFIPHVEKVERDPLPVPERLLASTGIRFLNFLVDMTVLTIGLWLTVDFIGLQMSEGTLQGLYLVYVIAYYILFEWLLNGRTVGKLLTGTRTVNSKGEEPTIREVISRTVCRFIPFEALSALFGRPWHDRFSETYVVQREKED